MYIDLLEKEDERGQEREEERQGREKRVEEEEEGEEGGREVFNYNAANRMIASATPVHTAEVIHVICHVISNHVL